MATYPEHEKIKALGGANQIVGDFIEWLGEAGYEICKRDHLDRLYAANERRDALIAKHFEIDEDRLESEKRAMLDAIRGDQASA